MNRAEVTFPSVNDTCAAWLYRPDQPVGDRVPIIVMGHGLDGVKEMRLDAFAERFVDAGYPVLVFDYRHFGDSTGEPRQLLDIKKQLRDWRSAIEYARSLDGIDPDRVILWGTSFSGGHVLVTAAHDSRIAAVIAQCPFTDGLASAAALNPISSVRSMVLGVKDAVASRRGDAPTYVPAYGQPGQAALMTAPGSAAAMESMIPDGVDAPNEVAARFVFQIIRYFPGRQARNIKCPVFFGICANDKITPPGPTKRYAEQTPHHEVELYNTGHFGVYFGQQFELNIDKQVDFLQRHVPLTHQA